MNARLRRPALLKAPLALVLAHLLRVAKGAPTSTTDLASTTAGARSDVEVVARKRMTLDAMRLPRLLRHDPATRRHDVLSHRDCAQMVGRYASLRSALAEMVECYARRNGTDPQFVRDTMRISLPASVRPNVVELAVARAVRGPEPRPARPGGVHLG